jgi:FkbM family methyltransferase
MQKITQLTDRLLGAVQRIASLSGRFTEPNASARRLAFFKAIKAHGVSIERAIDAGAHRGTWTRDLLRVYPTCNVHMLEPNLSLKSFIKDIVKNPNVSWHNVGVGDTSGIAKFRVAERDDSSYFMPDGVQADPTTIDVPITTLDDFTIENRIENIDLIKIDAEGFDLRALKGSDRLCQATPFFCLEAAVSARSLENTVERVIALMNERGYFPIDFIDLNRTAVSKVLWLCEIAFVKSDQAWLGELDYTK